MEDNFLHYKSLCSTKPHLVWAKHITSGNHTRKIITNLAGGTGNKDFHGLRYMKVSNNTLTAMLDELRVKSGRTVT